MNTQFPKFNSIDALKQNLITLAALNIILCEEEWSRYHKFMKNWSNGTDLAEIDNGSGDNMMIFFTENGCLIKGFDHESDVSPFANAETKIWDGMYDGLPSHFSAILDDESVEKELVTFCFWKEYTTDNWQRGKVKFENNENDGSAFLLETIFPNPKEFIEWSNDYFEIELQENFVSEIYNGSTISDKVILAINDACNLKTVKSELETIGISLEKR